MGFSLILLLLLLAVIRILGLEKLVFKGPKTVVQLITDTGLKSDRGRINVLLLGIGGQGHQGPNLSDTMILASINKEDKDIALVSIPRDLWAPNISAKINHTYAYGQEKDDQGLELAKETVSLLFDMPIHYAVRLDFGGFVKAVDLVGGLDIDVERAFVDPKYPIAGRQDDLCGLTLETQEKDGVTQQVVRDAIGSAMPLAEITEENNPFVCRYETITFKKGPTNMDGTTALKFVRSRHGTNGEGSDFARSARQQKVLLAFREKVLSSETLLNPKTIIDLINTFGQSIDTDINQDEIPLFTKLASKVEPSAVRRVILDSQEENGILEFGNPQNFNGQSVLVPKGGNWADLADYVQGEIFKLEEN